MADEKVETPEAPEEAPNPIAEWLAKASPDEILKNDRVQGIMGDRLKYERQRIRQELVGEQEAEARKRAEDELIQLAKTDQFAFAEKYLSKVERERIAQEAAHLKQATRSDFAQMLGKGYSALPEWSDLTVSEQEKLAQAVVGKSDDEALVSFNAAVLDVVTERRSAKRVAEFREKELANERAAIRQEESGRRLKTSDAPNVRKSNGAPLPADPTKLPDKEFNEWYTQNVLKGRR